jgi:hypothetical protein
MSIVECDDTTHAKQPANVEKVHQGVIEGVPPIDECEINSCSFRYESRECDLGFLFAKVYQRSETSFAKIVERYSMPAGWIGSYQNVTFDTNFRHCLACF